MQLLSSSSKNQATKGERRRRKGDSVKGPFGSSVAYVSCCLGCCVSCSRSTSLSLDTVGERVELVVVRLDRWGAGTSAGLLSRPLQQMCAGLL